ncbi:TRAP transporter small permease [Siccirubricoccus sp. KC 17139]|uniref:TRAP transporter small permease protein n=1 Tax=Siccirubricoccus soli TaxID=2899147 RepID=A0ABT1D4K9_9PROT|nr:TRAP transporter small permease [Siccirubricoccus soli]MCO6416861.1 TRAP transporter small permease [Siccirubricoccus soli]MCP2682996.1 TRAP transporter small permease [Siccirubricoccus soli]
MSGGNPVARWLEPPARWIAILGGWWLMALSALTVVEIFCRKFLSVSLQGVDEIGAYTLAVFSTLSFAHALLVKSHTRVDFLLGHMPGPVRAVLNALAYVLLAALAIYGAWRGWAVLEESLEFQSHANSPLQTPLWLPQSAWLAGLVAFAIAAGAFAAHAVLLLLTDWRRVNRLYGPLTLEEEVATEASAIMARGVEGSALAPEPDGALPRGAGGEVAR